MTTSDVPVPESSAMKESPSRGGGSSRRRRWVVRFAFAGLGVVLLVQWFFAPVIVQNTRSMPRGVWLRGFGPLDAGAVILAPMPESITPLLEAHGKPSGGWLLKPIAAVGPAALDTTGGRSRVGGFDGGEMQQESSIGIAYPEYRSVEPLGAGQVWLESGLPSSVDSRVFGPVDARTLRGPYWLAWAW